MRPLQSARRADSACVRASVFDGRCVFFAEVACKVRLLPPMGRGRGCDVRFASPLYAIVFYAPAAVGASSSLYDV